MIMSAQDLSYTLGVISVVFYSIVYFPQLRLIYKSKNSDNLSILMLILWSEADVLSLIGLIVLQLELSLIVIGWYHLFVGVAMMGVTYYYRSVRTIGDGVSILLFIFINVSVTVVVQVLSKTPEYKVGEILGWITTVIYIIGRFPQIYANFMMKSTENLSVGMYINTILGNTFYVASIFALSLEIDYLYSNLPWIVLAIISNIIDFFIVAQCYYYRHRQSNSNTVDDENVEVDITMNSINDITSDHQHIRRQNRLHQVEV